MGVKFWRRRAAVCFMWVREVHGIRIVEWRWRISTCSSITRKAGRWWRRAHRHRLRPGRRPRSRTVLRRHVGCRNGRFPLAGFNLGKYKVATVRAGDVTVETYATAGVERNFPSPKIQLIEPNPSDP